MYYMYLMYGEYDIFKQQGGHHHPLLEVDHDNSIWKYTFLQAMILVLQPKTRQSDFSAFSSSFVTVHNYIFT